MLGAAGHGKSSTANSLIKDDYFKVSNKVTSETKEVRGLVTTWLGEPNNEPIIVIDTPGIRYSEGNDTEHIANMVYSLKIVGFVNTFIIIINSEDLRLNE